MRKNLGVIAVLFFSFVMSFGCAAFAESQAPVRIDSSSPQAAKASYREMMENRSQDNQVKLALAVLTLNMKGVKSASEVVNNPELQSPSIVRIRTEVAGMTAEQIIALAARVPSVHIEPAGK